MDPSGTSDVFRLPVLFHGTGQATKKAWLAILKQAWKTGTWGNLLDTLETAPCFSRPGLVLLDGPGQAKFTNSEIHWRIYWIKDGWCPETFPHDTDEAGMQKEKQLICDGMRYLWFSLGMLCFSMNAWWYWQDKQFVRSVLRWYVHWLPEILAFRPYYGIGGIAGRCIDHEPVHGGPFAYLCGILRAAYLLEYPLIQAQVMQQQSGSTPLIIKVGSAPDVAAHLASLGVIRPSGDRYELVD
jgi:hypothetical protein